MQYLNFPTLKLHLKTLGTAVSPWVTAGTKTTEAEVELIKVVCKKHKQNKIAKAILGLTEIIL